MEFPKEKFEKLYGSKAAELAGHLRDLSNRENGADRETEIFDQLESAIKGAGFNEADTSDALRVFYDDSLLCRSENFTKIMDLLLLGTPIVIENVDDQANMCVMAGGVGFKVAMQEGFSGRDVGGIVKVVISFRDQHLSKRSTLGKNDELWRTKPATAQVSLSGRGAIQLEDIEMVSFRFPTQYMPENYLTEEEKDMLEDQGLKFIVRHFVPEIKKIAH